MILYYTEISKQVNQLPAWGEYLYESIPNEDLEQIIGIYCKINQHT